MMRRDAMAASNAISDDELLRLRTEGKTELVDGEVRVTPASWRHGVVCTRLSSRIFAFVTERGLGAVVDSSTGFRLPGGNLRSPDVSFVAAGRIEEEPRGFLHLAPDLAVEVLSPDDSSREVLDKVGEYLEAGVRLVWIVDPERRRAAAVRGLTDVSVVEIEGCLDGEGVLPGFRCPLAELLA